jgi:pimeloyl-ACP methyl ester carboxylesterase
MWQGMAQAFFDDDVFKNMVKRVIAIDLPGRGSSPAPANLDGGPYGNLLVEDNVGIIIQAISALDAQGLGPNVIMGHSMGGLEIQATQEALLAQDSSLAHLGVFKAILLAPVPVPSSIWNQPPPSDLSAYVVETTEYGQVLAIPPTIGLYTGGFTNLAGELVPTAPSPEEMEELVGWEPILAALQLSDQLLPDIPRPDAREGAFSPCNGTLLTVVGFSQDILVPADDLDDLYEYLTGLPGFLYHRIDSPYAVHSMCITEPEVVVEELRSIPAIFR